MKVHNQKRKKSLFIPIKLHSITISSVIHYTSKVHSTNSSLKKKKSLKKERGKENEMEKRRRRTKRWKRGEEEKRDGKSLCERKGKRENEMWKKRRNEGRENEREGEIEERRGRETRIQNRESGKRNVPPSPDAFPSTKLGNNITPIKGRLGKNTTPTSRGPIKLNQSPQADFRRRRPSLDASFRTDLSYAPEGAEYPKYELHSNEAAIYKKAKALGNSRNHFQFSMNQH